MEIYAVADLRALSCPRTTNVCAENRCSRTTETAIDIYFWLWLVVLVFIWSPTQKFIRLFIEVKESEKFAFV
jgi:hypothetical protein